MLFSFLVLEIVRDCFAAYFGRASVLAHLKRWNSTFQINTAENALNNLIYSWFALKLERYFKSFMTAATAET